MEFHGLSCSRMFKSQRHCMKGQSVERIGRTAIVSVSYNRMSGFSQMDPYLVLAPCFQPHFEKAPGSGAL